MEPTQKSEAMDRALTKMFGHDRRNTIRQNKCIPAPLGCGLPATEFRDEISRKEFSISGLCQICQDSVFENDDESFDTAFPG